MFVGAPTGIVRMGRICCGAVGGQGLPLLLQLRVQFFGDLGGTAADAVVRDTDAGGMTNNATAINGGERG